MALIINIIHLALFKYALVTTIDTTSFYFLNLISKIIIAIISNNRYFSTVVQVPFVQVFLFSSGYPITFYLVGAL